MTSSASHLGLYLRASGQLSLTKIAGTKMAGTNKAGTILANNKYGWWTAWLVLFWLELLGWNF